MRRDTMALMIAFLACVAGCSHNSDKAVYPVRGRVLYRGQPVANAQVTFHPVGHVKRETIRAIGKVDDRGYFALTSFKDGDGAVPGDYQVTVVWYLAQPVRRGSDETVSANYLPDMYAHVETSRLTATVTPGNNDLPQFDLK